MSAMNAAERVFNIPELLEYILISLPCDTTHQELSSMRTIILAQTTCRTWYDLLQTSTPIRQRIYRPTLADEENSSGWQEQLPFPPARPNPWIPDLLLNQRSWGSAYPFDDAFTIPTLAPSQPRYWNFTFEMSRSQYARLPPPGAWRGMLAASPPFTDCFYTRSVYELGSGRAPFVTHRDYDVRRPKSEQRYRVHCDSGITLGHLCDTMRDLFERHGGARFVMVESFRPAVGRAALAQDDRPATKTYIPGSSAEGAHGWQRGD